MDVSIVNRILNAFSNVMPQIGFTNIKTSEVSVIDGAIKSKGVMVIIGIIGDMQGNLIYNITEADAKKIASVMMMGMEVNEFNELAQSAVSELINMLTANATTNLADRGIMTDISTPTLISGDFMANGKKQKVVTVIVEANGLEVEMDMALEIIKIAE